MSITPISIQGQLQNADGSPATGTIVATPNSLLANGAELYPTSPIAGLLNAEGQVVAQSMYALTVGATDDAGTTPAGSDYTFTIKLDGSPIQEFTAAIPHASTATETNGDTVALSPIVVLDTLVAAESMVTQPITGTNIPGGTTVLSVNPATNSLTLSANASGTQLGGCQFVVGGAVELSVLLTNAL